MSQILVGPRNCPPTGRAADAVHGQSVRLLRFQQSVLGALAENAVRGQPQQPLEHLRGCTVCIPGATPADGRQNELLVGGAGVVPRGIAQPRCLCIAGIGVYDGAAVIPVDAHRLEILGGDDAQGHRVDAAVHHVKLKNNFAIAFFDNFLVIDRSKCKTAAQERTVLAHEAGHYMSGAFYRAYSPFEVKEQAEHRAFAASVEKYLPVNEILNCYKMGMTENWEIAEYFNLEEEFVEKAVHYWTDCKGIDFNCL